MTTAKKRTINRATSLASDFDVALLRAVNNRPLPSLGAKDWQQVAQSVISEIGGEFTVSGCRTRYEWLLHEATDVIADTSPTNAERRRLLQAAREAGASNQQPDTNVQATSAPEKRVTRSASTPAKAAAKHNPQPSSQLDPSRPKPVGTGTLSAIDGLTQIKSELQHENEAQQARDQRHAESEAAQRREQVALCEDVARATKLSEDQQVAVAKLDTLAQSLKKIVHDLDQERCHQRGALKLQRQEIDQLKKELATAKQTEEEFKRELATVTESVRSVETAKRAHETAQQTLSKELATLDAMSIRLQQLEAVRAEDKRTFDDSLVALQTKQDTLKSLQREGLEAMATKSDTIKVTLVSLDETVDKRITQLKIDQFTEMEKQRNEWRVALKSESLDRTNESTRLLQTVKQLLTGEDAGDSMGKCE